jgi:shikimate kinase
MKNIYLVGFMGTGKSVVGRSLAVKLKAQFLDLDLSIEDKQGRKIKDIFAKEGEAYFRNLEKQAVRDISKKDSTVVACGGGVVLDKDNLVTLKRSGVLICLTARPEVILKRCQGDVKRPLLNVSDPLGKIKELLAAREPFYTQADLSIDTSDLTVQAVVDKILPKISND